MQRIAIPKALMEGGDRLQRRATLTVDERGSWIDCTDMLRLTRLDVRDVLSKSADYQLVVKLVHLDMAWSAFQFAYAKHPKVYEEDEMLSDPFGRIALSLLQKGRRPSDLISLMDTSMLRFLLQMAERSSSSERLSASVGRPVCTLCGAPDPRLRCSACKELACIEVLYCSKGCQTADWKAHRRTCCKTRMTKEDKERMKALVAMQPPSVGARIRLLEGIMRLQHGGSLLREAVGSD
jgi:hypothetical protein